MATAKIAAAKRKASKQTAEQKGNTAQRVASATTMEFLALIDIARNCGKKGALNAFTVRETVRAMIDQLVEAIDEHAAQIKAPEAQKEIKQAIASLGELGSFADEMDCEANEENTSPWHGRTIYAYTLDAAQALARAGCDQAGWLDMSWAKA